MMYIAFTNKKVHCLLTFFSLKMDLKNKTILYYYVEKIHFQFSMIRLNPITINKHKLLGLLHINVD